MPGRTFTGASGYRYGFNGKENDNEVKGSGNQQDYGMRIYDSRIGRFLSVDPLTAKFAMLTPYQFASNTPIQAIDLDGLEARIYLDLSVPIGHAFISVTDAEGLLHIYTYGQYAQGHQGNSNKPIGEGALVHLVGSAANEYIKDELKASKLQFAVYEISKDEVDKQKIIDYYSKQMEEKPNAELKDGVSALEAVTGDQTGRSSAVKSKLYVGVPKLLPENVKSATCAGNCVSTVGDGLNAGGSDLLSDYTIPQIAYAKLAFSSATNVTSDAIIKAYSDVGAQPYKALNLPKFEFKLTVVPTFINDNTSVPEIKPPVQSTSTSN